MATERATSLTTRTSRAIIWSGFVVAVLFAATSLVAGISGIVRTLAEGRLPLTLSSTGGLPPEASAGSATIVDGGYDTASVLVANLSGGAMATGVAAAVFGALTGVVLAGTVAVIAWQLLRPTLFRRGLSTTVTIAGGVIMLTGLLNQGLSVFASWMAADELNAADAGLDGFWPIAAVFDPAAIALGFGLMLVGLAFEHGAVLQRDTEGLV